MLRLKAVILLLIVLIPTATLVPLGSLWLWQNGLALYWVFGSLIFTITMYAVAASTLNATAKRGDEKKFQSQAASNATEMAAWAAIEKFADTVDPTSIRSRNDLADIAAKTVAIVAREFHPTDKTPVWNFTVPELLLLTERVSGRLRPVFVSTIPLAEQLSVGQMLRLYEWRSVIGVAENAYDIWRLLRAVNPVAAVTQEAREKVTKQILTGLRDDLTHRLVRIIVEEIGSAAIDLYSGRLRLGAEGSSTGRSVEIDGAPNSNTTSRLRTAWTEVGKFGRSAHALYRGRPKKK